MLWHNTPVMILKETWEVHDDFLGEYDVNFKKQRFLFIENKKLLMDIELKNKTHFITNFTGTVLKY